MARYRVPASQVREHTPPKYGGLKILPDGRVRFLEEQIHPSFQYVVEKYSLRAEPTGEEYGLYDSNDYGVGVLYRSQNILHVNLRRQRFADAIFPVVPQTGRIKRWAALVRKAGLGPWVTPALFNTLRSMTLSPYLSRPRLMAMHKLIEQSIRDDLEAELGRPIRPTRRKPRRPPDPRLSLRTRTQVCRGPRARPLARRFRGGLLS